MIVTQPDGLRHVVIERDADPRIVLTRCGIRVAAIGGPPDPNSAYQRATRHDWTVRDCGACRG